MQRRPISIPGNDSNSGIFVQKSQSCSSSYNIVCGYRPLMASSVDDLANEWIKIDTSS